jgi:signal transduction histidine kinase
MGQSKSEVADGRAHTDASLDAERAISDVVNPVLAADARQQLDDLIERDRKLADIRLLKFRDGSDRILSHERAESPAQNVLVALERDSADQRIEVERNVADALLQRERQRSDVAVEADRSDQDALRIGLKERRQDTDDQLSMERRGADTTTNALDRTKSALVEAQTKEGQQRDVLGMVAHDLRSPLSVISLSAESIAERTKEAAIRTAAQAIELATVRMERLIGDLLDVARIESGTLRIIKRQHDISALLLEVLSSYGPMFVARDITFTVNAPPDSGEASFDYGRIVQVLSNLLGNAMKFTQAGGAVTLHGERQAEGMCFTVRDNGPGIAPLALPHVFERFWQMSSEVRRGLGLGLHICENIVRAHGGQIRAESELGKGATFRFTLPMM